MPLSRSENGHRAIAFSMGCISHPRKTADRQRAEHLFAGFKKATVPLVAAANPKWTRRTTHW